MPATIAYRSTQARGISQVATSTWALQSVAIGPLEEHLGRCASGAVAEGGDAATAKVKKAPTPSPPGEILTVAEPQDQTPGRAELVLTSVGPTGHLPAETARTFTSFTIFEGTSEIQRMIIGRAVTGLDVR